MILLLAVTWRISTLLRRRGWRLASSEDGSSYILTVAVIFPFYMIVIAVVIESTMLLVAKVGTTYAACAAARSAAVWLAADLPPVQRRAMVELAADQALAPFASGLKSHTVIAEGVADEQAARNWLGVFEPYGDGTVSPDYLVGKHKYAQVATSVKIETQPSPGTRGYWQRDVTVTVTYHYPIHIPGLGQVFGSAAPWAGADFATRAISSQATMQLEIPKSTNRRLGIHYDSWDY
jgi:hypothetical protein